MRELTAVEMEHVNGGFFIGGAIAGCGTGAVAQDNGALGGVMGCAGGTAASLAISLIPLAGRPGAIALIGLADGIGDATSRGQASCSNR